MAAPSALAQSALVLAANYEGLMLARQQGKDPRYRESQQGKPGEKSIGQSSGESINRWAVSINDFKHTFPRPISSARMPLIPWSYNVANQFSPFSWYSLSWAISMRGWAIVRAPLSEVGFWKLSSSESTVMSLRKVYSKARRNAYNLLKAPSPAAFALLRHLWRGPEFWPTAKPGLSSAPERSARQTPAHVFSPAS